MQVTLKHIILITSLFLSEASYLFATKYNTQIRDTNYINSLISSFNSISGDEKIRAANEGLQLSKIYQFKRGIHTFFPFFLNKYISERNFIEIYRHYHQYTTYAENKDISAFYIYNAASALHQLQIFDKANLLYKEYFQRATIASEDELENFINCVALGSKSELMEDLLNSNYQWTPILRAKAYIKWMIQHYQLKEFKQAEETALRSQTYFEQQSLPYYADLNQLNLAELYLSQKKYYSAIQVLSNLKTNSFEFEAGLKKAICYNNQEKHTEAINTLLAIKKIPASFISIYYNTLSTVYANMNDMYNALNFSEKGRKAAIESNQMIEYTQSLHQTSLIYQKIFDFENSLFYYKQYLYKNDSLLRQKQLALNNAENILTTLSNEENQIQQLKLTGEIELLNTQQLRLEQEKLELQAAAKNKEIALLLQNKEIQEAKLKNSELAAAKASQELKLAKQKQLETQLNNEITELNIKEEQQRFSLYKKEKEAFEAQQSINILNKEKKLQDLNLEKQKQRQKFLLWGLMGLSALSLGLFFVYRYTRKLNFKLHKQTIEISEQKSLIESEKQRSENLLLNILPQHTADELKTQGYATPRELKNVCIMFTDFVNFTQFSEKISPENLIKELNEYFSFFDHLIDKYKLEKIKTIGDAYMCAGGLNSEGTKDAENMLKAAIEMQQYMAKKQKEIAHDQVQHIKPELKIGMHIGTVVAGVVGTRKFAYDIWGDDVNLASRMESSCLPGRINMSESFYKIIKNQYECENRGKVQAKNKGEIYMYFLDEKYYI